MQGSQPLSYEPPQTPRPAPGSGGRPTLESEDLGLLAGDGVKDLRPPFPSDLEIPTRIRFGNGAVEELPRLCSALQAHRVVLISGSHSTAKLAKQIQNHLELSRICTTAFSAVEPEPSSSTVDAALMLIRESKSQMVVAIGGGSAIDVAKLAALASRNGGYSRDYEKGVNIQQESLPLIAIPTTSGSGSEATPYSVINSAETGRKFTVTDASLYPKHALVDPSLTLGLPPRFTLASGLDAWVHLLEAYLSRQGDSRLDFLIESTSRVLYENLAQAIAQPQNLSARTHMAEAATIAGMVISQVRTGLIHTLSVALAPFSDLPHGLLNATITPHVLEFNSGENDGRLCALVEAMTDAPFSTEPKAIELLRHWLEELGVTTRLSLETTDREVNQMIQRVRQDAGLTAVNPKAFSDHDLETLLRGILEKG